MLVKEVIKKIHSLFPIEQRFPLGYFIPVYHCVSNENLAHLKHLISYKNTKDFENDLDEMGKKFDFVDWDFFKNNWNKCYPKPLALLTFDDGLSEVKEVVLPILERKGIYAMNFINPAFVNNTEMMFRCKTSLLIDEVRKKKNARISPLVFNFFHLKDPQNKESVVKELQKLGFKEQERIEEVAKLLEVDFQEYQKKHQMYMNLEELQSIKNKGFGVAAHSWNHPYYHQLSLEKQLENTLSSLQFMKENNFDDDAFAFPFTDFGVGKTFFETLFQSHKNLHLTFGSAGIKRDSFVKNLQRIPMENGNSAKAELMLETSYFQLKKIANKNRIIRK